MHPARLRSDGVESQKHKSNNFKDIYWYYAFKTRCSVAERRLRARNKGGKLSNSREKRDEFLTPPRSCSSRGEPQAKLLGALSFDTFFGASKESINKIF